MSTSGQRNEFDVLSDRFVVFSCVQEPLGGAHSDPVQTSKNIKTVIMKYMHVSALFDHVG